MRGHSKFRRRAAVASAIACGCLFLGSLGASGAVSATLREAVAQVADPLWITNQEQTGTADSAAAVGVVGAFNNLYFDAAASSLQGNFTVTNFGTAQLSAGAITLFADPEAMQNSAVLGRAPSAAPVAIATVQVPAVAAGASDGIEFAVDRDTLLKAVPALATSVDAAAAAAKQVETAQKELEAAQTAARGAQPEQRQDQTQAQAQTPAEANAQAALTAAQGEQRAANAAFRFFAVFQSANAVATPQTAADQLVAAALNDGSAAEIPLLVGSNPAGTNPQQVIVPLTLPEDVRSLPPLDRLESLYAQDGELQRLLRVATELNATLAVDPRVFVGVRAYGDAAPTVARDFVKQLEESKLDNFLLQWSDASLATQQILGIDSPLQPTGVSYVSAATGAASAGDGQNVSRETSTDSAAESSGNTAADSGQNADASRSADATASDQTSLENLSAWKSQTQTMAWIPGWDLDLASAAYAKQHGFTRVLTTAPQRTDTSTDSNGNASLGGVEYTVADARLTELSASITAANGELQEKAAAARLKAILALKNHAGNEPVIFAPAHAVAAADSGLSTAALLEQLLQEGLLYRAPTAPSAKVQLTVPNTSTHREVITAAAEAVEDGTLNIPADSAQADPAQPVENGTVDQATADQATADTPTGAEAANQTPATNYLARSYEHLRLTRDAVAAESAITAKKAALAEPQKLVDYQRARILHALRGSTTDYLSAATAIPGNSAAALPGAPIAAQFPLAQANSAADAMVAEMDRFRETDASYEQGVRLVIPSQTHVFGRSAQLPVQVRNLLPFAATVKLHAAPGSAAFTVDKAELGPLAIAPGETITVKTNIDNRVSNAAADMSLTLTDASGKTNLDSAKYRLQISSSVEVIGLVILGLAALGLFGFGAWRSVKQHRQGLRKRGPGILGRKLDGETE